MVTTELAARMCPVCGSDCAVYKSWVRKDGVVVRRKKCRTCGTIYETEEKFSVIIQKKRKNNCKKIVNGHI